MQEGALHVRLHDLARGASLGFVEFGAASDAKQFAPVNRSGCEINASRR